MVAPTLLGDLAAGADERSSGQAARVVVYGDSAYGTGAHLAWLDHHGLIPMAKSQVATAPGGGSNDHLLRRRGAGALACAAWSAWPQTSGC